MIKTAHIAQSKVLLLVLGFLIVNAIHAADRQQMRNTRYCEIILSKSWRTLKVYNTWGLNDCPQKEWQNISATEVKEKTGSKLVFLNGPRYWVIDGFENTQLINPKITTILGLTFREAGILHLTFKDMLTSSNPYVEHVVNRHTTWIYNADKPIYELINPNGEVFVMQSYTVMKVPQTLENLATLKQRLSLPKGWIFKTGLLKTPKKLVTLNERAIVIQDNFLNTYQKASEDFLK